MQPTPVEIQKRYCIPSTDPLKRRRDLLQTGLVQEPADQYVPHLIGGW